MTDTLSTPEQLEISKRLQTKWLRHMETLLDSGAITSTDLATLQRFLSANGWVLDESRIPTRLKDKLTANFDPTQPDPDDKVVPIRAAGGSRP